MKVKRLEKRSMDFDFLERLAIGVAAAGGLVMAACISGLPSASCTALVETYSKAIGFFGFSALSALVGLATLIVAQQTHLRLSAVYRFVGYGILLIAIYYFWLAQLHPLVICGKQPSIAFLEVTPNSRRVCISG